MKKYTVIMVLSAVAIVNAAYLSYEAYQFRCAAASAAGTFCNFSESASCSNVLASPYSLIFGIPFPWIALVIYPVLLIIASVGLKKSSYRQASSLAILSGLGTCFNGFIIYREAVYIHSFCPLCLLCTAIIVTILVLSLRLISEGKHETETVVG
ncbi:MAG: hypothetical protein HGA31_05040 [Candidatus Moranbacteria bacterium]|nr:hypothetical protein [Candidatus Moranbacteria bacterium]